ncbi:52 kDa repressor of the inhibitor of the protein kinase-like isoform X2 [Myzus persicae]|nr:52 kDa repressor of the inhibitor of the protein kinase-like isoform X2 [Myzus persicae]
MNPEDYYRITIAIPCIDSFISNLKERFLTHKNIFEGFQCLFSDEIEYEAFEELVRFYLDSDTQIVIAELRIWQSKLKANNKNPKAAIDALRLLSTSTPERSFSCMKRLKTYLRNSMTENRLNGLTLLAVHREIPIDAKEVLDVMAQKSRKLDIIL